MTGDYNSVIGMKKENAIKRMRTGSNSHRLEPAEGIATISGAVITTKEGDTNSRNNCAPEEVAHLDFELPVVMS